MKQPPKDRWWHTMVLRREESDYRGTAYVQVRKTTRAANRHDAWHKFADEYGAAAFGKVYEGRGT